MRATRVPVAVLLLLSSSVLLQLSSAEDLYLDGEDGASNEFLEVKEEDYIGARIKRQVSDFFSFFAPFTATTTPAPEPEIATDDPDVENTVDEDDDQDHGSGLDPVDSEQSEKNLRVTFVVMEPYQSEFSNRDSVQFQNFSRSLADAVNQLYEAVPGTQRASLVRIQSRPSNEFSCKVTLDIVTSGYDNTDAIAKILEDHIKKKMRLQRIPVTDADFSANVIDPDLVTCDEDEIRCGDGSCVSGSTRCDGRTDCVDGADEAGCPSTDFNNQVDEEDCIPTYACEYSSMMICENQRCDGIQDCPNGSDELHCSNSEDENLNTGKPEIPTTERSTTERTTSTETFTIKLLATEPTTRTPPTRPPTTVPFTTSPPPSTPAYDEEESSSFSLGRGDLGSAEVGITTTSQPITTEAQPSVEETCPDGDIVCDNTRCISFRARCDGHPDCYDGTDEEGCSPKTCGDDDFRCNNNKCIEKSRRCDRIVDCPNEEDEHNCVCRPDEFRCEIDGSCIEGRKRCDGTNHCNDNSDELDCPSVACPADSFTCDAGSSVQCARQCDGLAECDDGEDEDDCEACSHNCDGRCLEESNICDGVSDCSDGSDELDCDKCDGPDDFRCNNRECIAATQRCNNIPECKDESDELNCNTTMTSISDGCSNEEFRCRDGDCINQIFVCDGNYDCNDNSDEENCQCRIDEFRCSSGQCVSGSAYCNGEIDCPDYSDEIGCVGTEAPIATTSRYIPSTEPLPLPPPTTQRPYIIQAYDRETERPRNSGFGGYYPQQGPVALNLKTYPSDQSMRSVAHGGEVTFQCRDEGPIRAPVRWLREGGRPFAAGYTEKDGRLELSRVTLRDSGVYICQARDYAGLPNSEVRATLEVRPEPVTSNFPFISCKKDEATCGNGQCIPRKSICNGVIDCSDRSDEENCIVDGKCQPNQFRCNNNKCILKTWLCDNDNDCEDGSDEESCGESPPGQCKPTEFACLDGNQCIPKSYHCDDQSDCIDGTDEIGCAKVYVASPPKPANVRLNVGDVLELKCAAVGVPLPVISWRLNWGDVPPQCTMDSQVSPGEYVTGTLTCPDMLPEHSGAYSCEAINNKGATFAVPDSIVFVNKTGKVCPEGYFNRDARSERECIRCFCFGESTHCQSADLFTYNMATPLGQGGTRLVGVKNAANGDVQIEAQDEYYYQPLRNGATVTKLARYNSNGVWSNVAPYLTLPETYNGNQLTSYGGHIRYKIAPHLSSYRADSGLPDVIIKGKYRNLVHFNRGNPNVIDARLSPENWQRPGTRGLEPASREDIMMALDNIELILIRASINNAGVNITQFQMESAQNIDVGLGAASLVEECTCPPGYEGLSCQKCAAGYDRERSGPWLGNCVARPPTCEAGYYGDPSRGYACRPCPCPLTNRGNQFATTCAVGSDGRVVCDCAAGYEGSNCERCAPGYVGNPLVPGDSCKAQKVDNCNPAGTSFVQLPDECMCKDNVQGRYCDQCKNGSFFLSKDFSEGCALCFCSGVTQECMSSNFRRKTTTIQFNTPSIVNQVRIYDSSPLGRSPSARYNAPVETNLTAVLGRGEITLANYDRSRPTIYYWSLPASFAGDKVTAYGGNLRYTLRRMPPSGSYSKNGAADVQLISENRLTFHYFGNFEASYDGTLEATVQFLEDGWQRPDGKEVSREHFLLALADVKAILVKATYTTNPQIASLVSASIETAEPNGDGPTALHVEQCICPKGYIGTSCEDCAPGFTRYDSGLYLEHCGPCECNGHSNVCHPETGVCTDCQDNTDGDNCEACRAGYRRDNYNNCVPDGSEPPTPLCDPRGALNAYSSVCECKQNVEGVNCDTCRRGTFGLNENNTLGCHDCYCSGVTSDCHEATSQYFRIPMAAPIFGSDYGGYRLTDLNGERTLSDHIVSMPVDSELMYVFDFPPDDELYWSLPVFPGNRVLSYGGTLQLKQKFESRDSYVSEPGTDVILIGDDTSVYWTNPQAITAGQPLSFQVPLTERGWYLLNDATPARRSDFMSVLKSLRRVLVRATLVKRLESSSIADVSMDTASTIYTPSSPTALGVEVCMCPEGYSGTSCETCATAHYKDQYRACQRCPCNGHDCFMAPSGEVQCNCRPPYTGRDCSALGGESNKLPPVDPTTRPPPPRITVAVQITSPTIKIQEVGTRVNFTCQAQSRMVRRRLPVTWSKVDGHLPQGRSLVDESRGMLIITNLQVSDSGKYICQTSDGISSAQAYATLKVPGNDMTMPTVEIRPPVNDYSEGERVQLECVANGNPSPKISWQRASGRPLPISAEIIDELFIIENARVADSGEYRCIASNTLGSVDRTAVLNIRPKPAAPTRESLTVSQSAPNINEGQSTRITCTGSANVPAGTIDWLRQDGTELQSNVRSVNGVLYIDFALPENQGVYVCQTSAYDVPPVLVVVSVIPTNPPPVGEQSNITVSVNNVRIPTGGSSSVDCEPVGYPLPLIKWTKHDGQFGPSTSQRDNTLIISNAREEDQGYYLCSGTVNGTPVANIYVYVEIEKREEPQIMIWPQGEQAVTLGSPFELQCRVTAGVPEPDVSWNRSGGRPLSPNVQLQSNNILRFESIEVNDEGEYSCTATSIAGTAAASATIKVRSPPEITVMPSDFVMAVDGDPITIECRASGYPLPTVSIARTLDRNREIVPAAPGIAVLTIPSASDSDDGDYICTAASPAGTISEQFGIRVESRGDGGNGASEGSGAEDDIDFNNPYDPQPNDLIAISGQPSRIECEISNDEYEVRWTRDNGMPLQRNAQQIGSSLNIRNTSKADSGQYICNLYDRYNREIVQSAYTNLRVIAAPRITLQPPTQTVRPGDSPTVECVVEGDEIEDITWRPVTRPFSNRVTIRSNLLIFNRIEVEDAGTYECLARNRVANASGSAEVIVSGSPDEPPVLVSIDQPRRQYRVGENVEVICRATSRGDEVTWQRYGTNQFVETKTFGDGAVLVVKSVQESDADVYRCTGRDSYGRTSYEDFNLEVQPGSSASLPQDTRDDVVTYTARLLEDISMPCSHNLERPVSIDWRRENGALKPEVRRYDPELRLEHITESDAGTYICRVSDSRNSVETRAILRVVGVVPRFDGNSWISLPTLRDAYNKFDIEISIKPGDGDGLILYNSQLPGREGDYLALQLINGVPQFVLDVGTTPVIVNGDRPLQLNTWHTIRISKTDSRVTMDVDNNGPTSESSTGYELLELREPLYIGGVFDYNQLPVPLAGTSGFIGCVSMLILGSEEKSIMLDSLSKSNVLECDSCTPNVCYQNGVCQEARNERGYVCLCADGYSGLNCDRTGEACRPGLCGPGKCSDTADGYKCACPITYTGKHCESKQSIAYPAFTGSAYLAIKAPRRSRFFRMSMKLKAASPVTDGVIMYYAESQRGYGGFTSLTVHNGHLEFTYDLGDGSRPVVLTSNRTLPANEWTDVNLIRVGKNVTLKTIYSFEGTLESPKLGLNAETPMFVGGVDDSVVLNKNVGVSGGFSGCIKDVRVYGDLVDIVNSSIQSANVQECSNYDRGDIPEVENICSQCRNGAECSSDGADCICPAGFTGRFCESRVPLPSRRMSNNPCAAQPCRNGGTCRKDLTTRMNYTCDCPLGYAGANCQMRLELGESVGFNGNGYLELPSEELRYDRLDLEPAVIALAFHTSEDGVLLYQREALSAPNYGDFILIRIENGVVVMDWDLGGGLSTLTIDDVFVEDGDRHSVIAKLFADYRVSLNVDGNTKNGTTTGFSNFMNADSNIYIGGIPEKINTLHYPGLTGCIEQIELMGASRGIRLGTKAVTGRNTQRCRKP